MLASAGGIFARSSRPKLLTPSLVPHRTLREGVGLVASNAPALVIAFGAPSFVHFQTALAQIECKTIRPVLAIARGTTWRDCDLKLVFLKFLELSPALALTSGKVLRHLRRWINMWALTRVKIASEPPVVPPSGNGSRNCVTSRATASSFSTASRGRVPDAAF